MSTDDARFNRLEDLLQLTLMLQGSLAGVALKDVEERFDVARRTATRMLTAVRRAVGEESFESETGRDGLKRWRLVRPKVGGLFSLTADELAAIEQAGGLAEREGDARLARELGDVTTKLRALSKPEWLRKVDPDLEALAEAQGFAFRAGPRPRIDDALLEQLRHAIVARKQVKVRHRKSPEDRAAWQTVGPLGFLYGNQHYLVAWSERRRQVVLFRLARIDRVELLSSAFDPPDEFDLDAYARRSFGVFQEDPVDVAWRFKPRVAAEARECVFHPDQVVEEQRDGSIVVRFRAGGLQEMAWHLLTWGRDVEVLEPAKLRRELIKWSMQAIRQHGREVDGEVAFTSLGASRSIARGASASAGRMAGASESPGVRTRASQRKGRDS